AAHGRGGEARVLHPAEPDRHAASGGRLRRGRFPRRVHAARDAIPAGLGSAATGPEPPGAQDLTDDEPSPRAWRTLIVPPPSREGGGSSSWEGRRCAWRSRMAGTERRTRAPLFIRRVRTMRAWCTGECTFEERPPTC